MSSPDFFRGLCLFVVEDFVSSDYCLNLRLEMEGSAAEKATVVGDGVGEILKEEVRKVLSVCIAKETFQSTQEQLRAIKPRLEKHFRVPLSRKCHGPDFLIYHSGSFYRPHRDADEGSPEKIRSRRVSVVVFLNGQSQEHTPDTFGGGGLTFYGLMEGPEWSKCAFTLDPTPGMLVAFRSNTLHEAQPVSFGKRYAIVTWFTQAEERREESVVESETSKQVFKAISLR
jgi:SM-20-related protein